MVVFHTTVCYLNVVVSALALNTETVWNTNRFVFLFFGLLFLFFGESNMVVACNLVFDNDYRIVFVHIVVLFYVLFGFLFAASVFDCYGFALCHGFPHFLVGEGVY